MPSQLLGRAVALSFIGSVLFGLAAGSAAAHAVIIDSVPAVGAVLKTSDSEIALHYNSRIDHQRSRLTLVSADGSARSIPIEQESRPDVVAAKLSGLAPGQYRLRWQVLAIDGHLTRGDIPFSVQAP
jgi:methionine-rich copper-binding protein CopC